ncbi:hypothetical protein Hanom_Chr11g01033641 [Helianthus anomalus]
MVCCKQTYYPSVLNDYIVLSYYPICFVVRNSITPHVKYFIASLTPAENKAIPAKNV